MAVTCLFKFATPYVYTQDSKRMTQRSQRMTCLKSYGYINKRRFNIKIGQVGHPLHTHTHTHNWKLFVTLENDLVAVALERVKLISM